MVNLNKEVYSKVLYNIEQFTTATDYQSTNVNYSNIHTMGGYGYSCSTWAFVHLTDSAIAGLKASTNSVYTFNATNSAVFTPSYLIRAAYTVAPNGDFEIGFGKKSALQNNTLDNNYTGLGSPAVSNNFTTYGTNDCKIPRDFVAPTGLDTVTHLMWFRTPTNGNGFVFKDNGNGTHYVHLGTILTNQWCLIDIADVVNNNKNMLSGDLHYRGGDSIVFGSDSDSTSKIVINPTGVITSPYTV